METETEERWLPTIPVRDVKPKEVYGSYPLDPVQNNSISPNLDSEAEGLAVLNPTNSTILIQCYPYRVQGLPHLSFMVPAQSWIQMPVPPYRALVATAQATDSQNGPIQIQCLAHRPKPAQGTMAAHVGTVALTGSLAPLADVTPTLIATIPYSAFTTASQSIYQYQPAVMHRHARARTILFTNTMDQDLTSVGFFPYDSQTAEGTPSGVGGGFSWGSGPGSGGGVMALTSEQASQGGAGALAAHVDSCQLGFGIGSTLPSKGHVYVHLAELF